MDALILGAGAAGLFCALEASRRGRSVLVLDHSPEPGRKILVSGGGRCNFTNLLSGPDFYASSNPRFCASALARFSPAEFVLLVEGRGIPFHEKEGGQLFCDRGAADIRDMLWSECRAAGAEFALGRAVDGVTHSGGTFTVSSGRDSFTAPRLVVATGGLSAPATGATGLGFDLARQFGHRVVEPEPALVGLRWRGEDARKWAALSGVSLPGVAVSHGKEVFPGSLLFTHTGLSGPAVLQASLQWRPGDPLAINLMPGEDIPALLRSARTEHGSARLWNLLAWRFPRRFADNFAGLHLSPEPLARLSDADLDSAARKLGSWEVSPGDTEGFERAEVTRGGVDTVEVSSQTMESRLVPGLHFAGEVLDVTGRLGGFNLHWAWASGAAAGRAL